MRASSLWKLLLGLSLLGIGVIAGLRWNATSPPPNTHSLPADLRASQEESSQHSNGHNPAAGEPETAKPVAEAIAETVVIDFPADRWAAAGLKVQSAESAPMTESIELTGKIALNEDRLAHIFPLVDGRVDEVKVQFGQRVKQGDLLVVVQSKEVGQGMLQLYQDRLRREFAQSRLEWNREVGQNTQSLIEMLRAGATIADIERSLKDRTMGDFRQQLMSAYLTQLKAKAHLDRLSPLSESGAVPARQILEAETELSTANASLQSLLEQISQDAVYATRLAEQAVRELDTSISVAESNLRILGFQTEQLQNIDPDQQGDQIAHYPVTAPFDGTVISKDVVLLERVGPERQILTIADLSSVWVTADIYESHLPLLNTLQDRVVRLRCSAWPGRTFEARIFYTGDVLQESTRTLALRAIAANAEGLLKPGMFVTVELPNLNSAPVVQVPLSAIQDHAGKTFVFLQAGDATFVRRDVQQGRRNQEFVEIRSGVSPGDRVVIAGGFALKSQMLAELLAE